jgi:hypothetical protein
MSNFEQADEPKRRKLQFFEDGTVVPIEDTRGLKIDATVIAADGQVLRPKDSVVLENIDADEWQTLKRSLDTHDVVFDNRTKALRLIKKPKRTKE